MEEKSFLGRSPKGFHRVAYTAWGNPSIRPPVICVHGLTRNGRDFDYLASALEADAQLYCPDIVGRGRSDWLADPNDYNYSQYLADMTALLARTGASDVDWVGTSMGGVLGMFLAAETDTPIRRLVINDIGPSVSLLGLKRIGAYVGLTPEFSTLAEAEKHMREIYAGFGELSDEQWRHLARFGTRELPNGRLTQAYDPAIAKAFLSVDEDVDFWEVYDRIRCPVLLIHGLNSDILTPQIAEQMTWRGPKAELIEVPKTGHAPALMDLTQIAIIAEFLRR